MLTSNRSATQKRRRRAVSELARWILLNTGDGIERSKIAEGFFKLERLYCGYYLDPCFTISEAKERNSKYKKAQPLITKTVYRLEQLGFVRIIRRKKYVKEVYLTDKGKAIAEELSRNE
jgi:hypothetical protein